MSDVWAAVVAGLFDLLKTALTFALILWFFSALMRRGSKHFGKWGQPDGELSLFDPRRLWCKHRVAWWGPGTHGLWALWCDACGRRVNRK